MSDGCNLFFDWSWIKVIIAVATATCCLILLQAIIYYCSTRQEWEGEFK